MAEVVGLACGMMKMTRIAGSRSPVETSDRRYLDDNRALKQGNYWSLGTLNCKLLYRICIFCTFDTTFSLPPSLPP
jgi:hypothetical protein